MPTPTPDPASPASIAGAQFRLVRRGFDPAEVSAFLGLVARELTRLSERERVLDAELRAMRNGASAPVVDESTVARLLGDEAARVLEAAREAAARIRERAEADAAAEVERAKATGRDMVDEARLYRDRVVADVNQRRDAVRTQLEQALAARTRMLDAFERSREAVVHVLEELSSDADPLGFDAVAAPEPEPVSTRADAAVAERRAPAVAAPFEPAATGPETGPQTEVEALPDTEDPAVVDSPIDAADDPVGDMIAVVVDAEREADPEPTAEPEPIVAQDPVAAPEPIVEAEPTAEAEPVAAQDPSPEPSPEPMVVDLSESVADGASESSRAAVDDLFARLRAARLHDVAERATTPERTSTEPAGTEPTSAAHPDVSKAGTSTTPDPASIPVTSSTTRPADAPNESNSAASVEPDADSPFIRRDAAVTPLIVAAARKVKRALADEQNELLARLTGRSVVRDLAAALGSPQDADQRYLDAIAEELGAAVDAGARSVEGSPTPAARAAALADAGALFHDDVLVPLRERLARCVADADGDQGELTASVRVAYREWKNQRIDERLDDVVHLAYGAGVLAGVVPGSPVHWAIDPRGPSCADAEDNVLGGAVAAGDAFPTGHRCAPAHAGCRCLVQLG